MAAEPAMNDLATLVPGPMDTEGNDHTMLSLIMAIFIFYTVMSLGIYLSKTLSPESFYSLATSVVLMLWAYKEAVIEFISPALLRLFGAGGQGYLHLLSLWFVDPRDLTLVGVATRVLAGSYSAVLAAIFFIPLFLAVCIYVMNVYDALNPQVSEGGADEQQENAEQRRTHERVVQFEDEEPMVFEPDDEFVEDRFMLTEFDTNAILVLGFLGKGMTSQVVLSKVDLSRVQQPPVPTQPGSLFGHSSFIEDEATESNFWGDPALPSNPNLALDDETTRTTSSSGGSTGHANQLYPVHSGKNATTVVKQASVPDMHDALIDEVEELSSDRTKALTKLRAFGPGGGPIPTGVNRIQFEGGWRKIEPDRTPRKNRNQLTTSSDGSSPMRPINLGRSSISREESDVINRPSVNGTGEDSLRPMRSNRASSASIGGPRGIVTVNRASCTNLENMIANEEQEALREKLRNNIISATGKKDVGTQNTGLEWWDEGQRRKFRVDEIYPVAPYFARNPFSISEFAQMERAETGGSSRSSGGGDADRRRGSTVSFDKGAFSPKLSFSNLRYLSYPSAVSLTESELNNLEGDYEDEEFGGRRTAGMEELPQLVAVKMMRKIDISRTGMRKTVENERRALAICASPFVCNVFGAFQDTRFAYLLLEPVSAGDLAGLLDQRNVMFEDEARFYIGCLLLALEHLHARGITCLDVKPENLLLDEYGYCKLCDLGISRISSTGNNDEGQQLGHWNFAGTYQYMAPEVVFRHKISPGLVGVAGPDLWATGSLLFELLSGETPFEADTNADVIGRIERYVKDERACSSGATSAYRRIANRIYRGSMDANLNNADVEKNDFPEDSPQISRVYEPLYKSRASPEAFDLVRNLLRSDPRHRLGCLQSGARTLMNHPWFMKAHFDWNKLRRREMKAPFVANPFSIPAPFRGEHDLDETGQAPLSLDELQLCLDYIKGSKNQPDSSEMEMWKGFAPMPKPNTTQINRKSPEFQSKVRHVQELFKREND